MSKPTLEGVLANIGTVWIASAWLDTWLNSSAFDRYHWIAFLEGVLLVILALFCANIKLNDKEGTNDGN